MKRILGLFVFAFVLTLAAQAQCGSNVNLTGCVGVCGSSYSATYTVTTADLPWGTVGLFCLMATENSLCPDHNAFATMSRNGGIPQTGFLNLGDVLSFKAHAGDVFTITVNLTWGDPQIDCIWLGQTEFALVH